MMSISCVTDSHKSLEQSPQELMMAVAEAAYFCLPEQIFWHRCSPKPGDAYNKLPEHVRHTLSQLKSDDIKNLRVDGIFLGPPFVWSCVK